MYYLIISLTEKLVKDYLEVLQIKLQIVVKIYLQVPLLNVPCVGKDFLYRFRIEPIRFNSLSIIFNQSMVGGVMISIHVL